MTFAASKDPGLPMPILAPARLVSPAARSRRERAGQRRGKAATPLVACGARLLRCHGPALLLLAGLGLAGCGGSGVPCRYGDMDDQMMSTRTAFLERMAGCPIGGYN